MGTNICSFANHTIDIQRGGASILEQVGTRLSISILQRKREHENYYPFKQWYVTLCSDKTGDWLDNADITWLHNQSFDLHYSKDKNESTLSITIYPKLVQLNLENSYEWTSFATDAVLGTGDAEYFGTYRMATLAAAKVLGNENVLHMGDKLMDSIFDWDYKDTVETLIERATTQEDLIIWDMATQTVVSGTMPHPLSEYDHAFHRFILIEDWKALFP